MKALPIKHEAALLSQILFYIINRILEPGNFSDELKLAKVIPAYKEAEKQKFITTDQFLFF